MSEPRRKRAQRLVEDGRLEEALEIFLEISEADATDVSALAKVAELAGRLGQRDRAILAHQAIARRYAADGLLLKAIAAGKTILELDPDHRETQEMLADLYAQRRDSIVPPPARPGQKRFPTGAETLSARLQDLIVGTGPSAVPDKDEKLLPTIPLFSSLPKEAFVDILTRMTLRKVPAGEVVIAEGAVDRSFFVLSTGRVTVTKRLADGTSTVLAQLTDGAFFGEMALLQEGPRTASVTAAEDSEIFELKKDLLDDVVARYPSVARVLGDFYQQRLLTTMVHTHPLFRPFNALERRQLISLFLRRTFPAGTTVIEQGVRGEGLFVVLSGRLVALRVEPEGTTELGEVRPGELCGEMSLLSHGATTARIVAAVDSLVLRLGVDDFEAISAVRPEIRRVLEATSSGRVDHNRGRLEGGRPSIPPPGDGGVMV